MMHKNELERDETRRMNRIHSSPGKRSVRMEDEAQEHGKKHATDSHAASDSGI